MSARRSSEARKHAFGISSHPATITSAGCPRSLPPGVRLGRRMVLMLNSTWPQVRAAGSPRMAGITLRPVSSNNSRAAAALRLSP
jgi:hypothetical protein